MTNFYYRNGVNITLDENELDKLKIINTEGQEVLS